MTAPEPRNPFWFLLLLTGVVFCVTALACAVVPYLEQQALAVGAVPPPSPLRDALRSDGWKWLLVELAVLILLGLAAMGLDRYRRLRREKSAKKSGER